MVHWVQHGAVKVTAQRVFEIALILVTSCAVPRRVGEKSFLAEARMSTDLVPENGTFRSERELIVSQRNRIALFLFHFQTCYPPTFLCICSTLSALSSAYDRFSVEGSGKSRSSGYLAVSECRGPEMSRVDGEKESRRVLESIECSVRQSGSFYGLVCSVRFARDYGGP